ncbi:methyltransferase [Helicobacter sp. MIT 05-5294]|uniref:tRNA1(Val) (adenine(37)-N6)-methyltransferase n=1 Tax=Helicobacter sp. MIT 05-5294 TaxID=1548150 RepID=UPI00051FCAFB|nr:methyltransferase [Helicobacter sp. MIT 05-5294]TLD85741.1 SAM-dependent methyltransferase [Helicobacter sp. MIT 05-5294]
MLIYQPKKGYCYNSDTLFLYDFTLPFLRKRYHLLEVGAGCGILGMLCKRDCACALSLIEKNPKMAELCAQNLRVNQIQANLICADFLEYDFYDSDIFKTPNTPCIQTSQQDSKSQVSFDMIISNPPFYHDGVIKSQNAELFGARYVHNLPFEPFVRKVNSLLTSEGEFIFCYDAKAIFEIFNVLQTYKIRPICLRFVYPKVDKSATLVLCRSKKNSKSQCKILPPLLTHIGLDFTEEVLEIYKRAQTWSIKC